MTSAPSQSPESAPPSLTAEEAFQQGMERYEAGEDPQTLIPWFKEICDRAPKNATAWSCLAWLYLLADRPSPALKAAQRAVKVDPKHPQAQVNLALSMLAAKRSGVRPHVELASQIMALDQELSKIVLESLEEGLQRKPDWEDAKRVRKWLLG